MATQVFLGRYEVVRSLGEGGMGRVYLAKDYNLARQVVLKVLHPHIAGDEAFRQRFEAEALLMAQFEHPYAVRVYDAGCDPLQGPCIVMEFIKGFTLAELLRKNRGRLSAARLYRLLTQLCEVLQAAHDAGIIHRDLKPANLMVLEPDSPSEKIKVMDFGLAKICAAGEKQARQSGHGLGTPSYMSPEQGRGWPLDHRSDLYSVGVILYEALTGRLPFKGGNAVEVLLAHMQDDPPGFAELGDIGTIPWRVEDVVRACLAKDPAQRPANAQELLKLYKAALFDDTPPGGQFKETPDFPVKPVKQDPQIPIDPNAVVYHMEAQMTRSVAEHKLRGFVHDNGGKVVESIPGMIRVRLGQPDGPYEMSAGALSWLGFGRDAGLVEVYLYLRQNDPKRTEKQTITVLILSMKKYSPEDPTFRKQCTRIYADLRGYLMGQDVQMPER